MYRDFGSLVSLGEYSTVGSLMGKLLGGSIFVEGLFARIMYISLYRMHLYALHGAAKVSIRHAGPAVRAPHRAAGEAALRYSDQVETLRQLLAQHGLSILFVNVLLAQLGLPLPAMPMLIVAGALIAEGTVHVAPLALIVKSVL